MNLIMKLSIKSMLTLGVLLSISFFGFGGDKSIVPYKNSVPLSLVKNENGSPFKAGVYKNSQGYILTISNVTEAGFSYALKGISDDTECSGLEFKGDMSVLEGESKGFDMDPNAPEDELASSIKSLNENTLVFEPSTSAIGMDCQRVFDTDFILEK